MAQSSNTYNDIVAGASRLHDTCPFCTKVVCLRFALFVLNNIIGNDKFVLLQGMVAVN